MNDGFGGYMNTYVDKADYEMGLEYKTRETVDSGVYGTQCEAFYTALFESRETPLTSLREMMRSHPVSLATDFSAQSGRKVLMEVPA